MALYIQEVDGLMKNLWDSPPPVPLGQDGWKEAVEVFPTIQEGRQKYGRPIPDFSTNPVELNYEVINVSEQERKEILISYVESDFLKFTRIVERSPLLYTAEEIAQAKVTAKANMSAINAATTHDELDAVVIQKIQII